MLALIYHHHGSYGYVVVVSTTGFCVLASRCCSGELSTLRAKFASAPRAPRCWKHRLLLPLLKLDHVRPLMPCCSWYSDFGYFWVKKSYLDVGSSRYSHISSYLSIHSLFMFSCCSWGVDLANIAVLAGSPVELLMGRHRCQGPKLCHGLGRCSSYKERDNLTEICGKTLYMWWKNDWFPTDFRWNKSIDPLSAVGWTVNHQAVRLGTRGAAYSLGRWAQDQGGQGQGSQMSSSFWFDDCCFVVFMWFLPSGRS